MAKSIRSKIMKRHRATMRRTVGEAQEQKTMRKALRRLKRSVEEQSATVSGSAADGTGSSLGAIAAALGGAGSSSAGSSSAATAAIAVPAGPARTKTLRYTFNPKLREDRIKADLEDLTDDEEDVRMGRVEKLAAAAGAGSGSSAGAAVDDDDDEDGVLEFRAGADGAIIVEEAGVKKAAGKVKPKRGNFFAEAPAAGARPGSVGFYETDPALKNPRRAETHRKGKLRAKLEAAAIGKPKK